MSTWGFMPPAKEHFIAKRGLESALLHTYPLLQSGLAAPLSRLGARPPNGNLGFQGTGSPTQAMLDMQIRKAEVAVKTSIEVSPETLAYDEIAEVLNSGKDIFL